MSKRDRFPTAFFTLSIDQIGPSDNVYFGRGKFTDRSTDSTRWKWLMLEAVQRHRIKPVTYFPVRIVVEARFSKGRQMYDADNVHATAKLAIDGLVRAGVLPGDTPEYVASVETRSVRSGTKESSTFILCTPFNRRRFDRLALLGWAPQFILDALGLHADDDDDEVLHEGVEHATG